MPKQSMGDIDMYYESNGEGQPLLLLHGLGSSTRDWECQLPMLSKHFQTITVDLRGHGRTDKPAGPYSVELFAADVAALIQALDLGPSHVVGISMGGMVGFQLALDKPELVKTLVVVNSGAELLLKTFKENLMLGFRRLLVRWLGMKWMGKLLAKQMFPEPQQQALRQKVISRWAENDKRAYLDSIRALVGWSVADRLGAVQCPTLVVVGELDDPLSSVTDEQLARIPRAERVTIKNSRHGTPFDQPDELNRVLLDFLSR